MNTIAVLVDNCSTSLWPAMIMGFSSKRASPGDVTVAGRIVGVAAFAEDPFCSGIGFAEGKVISGEVAFAAGGDVETQAVGERWSVGASERGSVWGRAPHPGPLPIGWGEGGAGEEGGEGFAEELGDLGFASGFV